MVRQVPVSKFVGMRARIEATLRECTLIVLGGGAGVPHELLVLAERATTEFAGVLRAVTSASPVPVRVDSSGTLGDFAVDFPLSIVPQLRSFEGVVRELSSWCESNHLLHTPSRPRCSSCTRGLSTRQ